MPHVWRRVLCCLRTPCHRYVKSTTASGTLLYLLLWVPASSFSLKKHYTDRLLGRGMDDLQSRNLFSQYTQFSFGLFDRVQFGTRRMLLPKPFLCLASVFWSLLLVVPPCSRCFREGLTFQPVLQKLASASPVSDCFSHPLGSLHFLIAGS